MFYFCKIVTAMMMISCFCQLKPANCAVSTNHPIIAITQIIEHPSLDVIRNGIIDALKDGGLIVDENCTLIYENAQGNTATAAQIAQKFAAEKPDVIVAIATLSAQAVHQVVRSLDIPVVFSAVTDPIGAGLIRSLTDNNGNITGTIDMPSGEILMHTIRSLMPNLDIMAIIYSTSEINSLEQITAVKAAARKYNISIIEIATNQTTDVVAAAQKAVGQASAIYIPNDNVVISVLESVVQVADAARIPVFTNNFESLARGAIASVANDQYKVGVETGKLVLEVLQKHDAGSIPVKVIKDNNVNINSCKAAKLSLKLNKN